MSRAGLGSDYTRPAEPLTILFLQLRQLAYIPTISSRLTPKLAHLGFMDSSGTQGDTRLNFLYKIELPSELCL